MNSDESNLVHQKMDETGPRYPADDARGGEIILRTRRRRVIFIGGLIAWAAVMLLVPILF